MCGPLPNNKKFNFKTNNKIKINERLENLYSRRIVETNKFVVNIEKNNQINQTGS